MKSNESVSLYKKKIVDNCGRIIIIMKRRATGLVGFD